MSVDFEERLSKIEQKVADNFEYMKEVVNDFKQFMNKSVDAMTETSKTMIKVQENLKTTSENQARLEQCFRDNQKEINKKLEELEEKIDENEEAHKIDTRPLLKGILTKILTVIIIAGLGIGLLISLLT
jgi:uncharacterized protein Yka (UPF0111/DUF47 family)